MDRVQEALNGGNSYHKMPLMTGSRYTTSYQETWRKKTGGYDWNSKNDGEPQTDQVLGVKHS